MPFTLPLGRAARRIAAALALTLTGSSALAEPPAPSAQEPAPAVSAAAQEASPVSMSVRPGQGITARTESGDYGLTIHGRLQIRDTALVPEAGGAASQEIAIRRARLFLSGNVLSPRLEYLVQLAFAKVDFEPDSASPLYDAYVTSTYFRDLNVRIGQFRVPFGRARLISAFSLLMVDRSPATVELNLDRDVGIQVSSSDLFGLGGRVGYQLGVFGGEGRNRLGGGPGLLYVGRVQLNPLGDPDEPFEGDLSRSRRPRVSLGVSGAYNENTVRQRSTTGPTFTLGGVDYMHAAADLSFKWAGFSLLAEGMWRDTPGPRVRTGGDVTEHTRSAWGYFAQAGAALTDRLEVAARWSHVVPLGATDPAVREDHEAGAGLTFHAHRRALKVQTDYAYLFGDAAEQGRHQMRLQVQVLF